MPIVDHGRVDEDLLMEMFASRRRDLCKGNLRYEEGTNGEGIWILPCTDKDQALEADDNSSGEVLYAWLCNNPLCPEVSYGSKVAFLTNGALRPYSQEIADDRTAYDALVERLRTGSQTH